MKNVKKLLSIICIVIFAIFLNSTKCFATKVQYTEDMIPTMTSNTALEGTASASSTWSTDYLAWQAFNDTTPQYSAWVTAAGQTTGWLEYDFIKEKCITKYTLLKRDAYEPDSPKDWTF